MTNSNATGILIHRPLAADMRQMNAGGRAAARPSKLRAAAKASAWLRAARSLQWICLILAFWLIGCTECYNTPLWLPLTLAAAALSCFRLTSKRQQSRHKTAN